MDRRKIIETYNQIEEEAGGLWQSVPSETLTKTAEKLNVPRETVRDVMIDHWTCQGAG